MSRALVQAAAALICAVQTFGAAIEGQAADSEVVRVIFRDHQFHPTVVVAKPGQKVLFVNQDPDLHSIVVPHVLEETFVDPGTSLMMVVPDGAKPGDYPLACTIHVDMTGTLHVVGR